MCRGRLLPSGWTVYQPGPLEEAPRQPGAEARASGAGASAGTGPLQRAHVWGVAPRGGPGRKSTGNPEGLLFQKPSIPLRPHTARQSSLLPTWGPWSLGQPRHTHP